MISDKINHKSKIKNQKSKKKYFQTLTETQNGFQKIEEFSPNRWNIKEPTQNSDQK